MIYWQLFLSFLQIGAFSFGGGYAAMPLIQDQVIEKYHWMTMADFTDLVTISQMTPGPIAINAATFIGTQMGGMPGALAATLGCILPSCIFVSILAVVYTKYRGLHMIQGILGSLRPAVVALILSAGLMILLPALFVSGAVSFAAGNFQVRACIWFIAAIFMLRKCKWDPVLVMVLTGVMELCARLVLRAG